MAIGCSAADGEVWAEGAIVRAPGVSASSAAIHGAGDGAEVRRGGRFCGVGLEVDLEAFREVMPREEDLILSS